MARVLVIGPGPSIIGEGGELDAAAAEAARTLRARRHEVILVTSNPATVSSDPSLAYRTYLEPLDLEAVRAIIKLEKPSLVVPFCGGTKALELALALHEEGTLEEVGAELLGLSPEAISESLTQAALAPAKRAALRDDASWTGLEVTCAFDAEGGFLPVCTVESLDRIGVHPGDAIGVTPPLQTSPELTAEIHEAVRTAIVSAGLKGGIATCDLAVRRSDDSLHVLAVTPGATRPAALASLATGYPLFAVAVELALGWLLTDLKLAPPAARGVVVRWPRFAFETFRDADAALGVRRKSLGESLGRGATLADALRSAARGGDDGLAVARPVNRASMYYTSKRILVLGAGPSRIGHGPELAACASEALIAARELGFEPVFVDSSVESASIGASSADHVHVAPVTLERVLAIYERDGAAGIIVQVGGDTALRLATDLASHGARVFGTPPEAIAALALTVERTANIDGDALDNAVVVDVDAVADGTRVVIAGVMEHLEPAFVHGGDAAAILPAFSLRPDVVARVEDRVRAIALKSGVVGLLAVRIAVSGDEIIVLDVEPRAGRTTCFVSRATGFPLVRIATKVMLGKTLDELGVNELPLPRHVAARERVFPFERLGIDPALGREMRSTGEVIGLDDTPARAYAKALRGIGISLRAPAGATVPSSRFVLLSVSERDTTSAVDLARRFRAIGFEVMALGTMGLALTAARVPFHEAVDPLADIRSGKIAFAIVTTTADDEIALTRALRAATLAAHIPCFTTLALSRLGCSALEEDATPRIRSLQAWYAADAD